MRHSDWTVPCSMVHLGGKKYQYFTLNLEDKEWYMLSILNLALGLQRTVPKLRALVIIWSGPS